MQQFKRRWGKVLAGSVLAMGLTSVALAGQHGGERCERHGGLQAVYQLKDLSDTQRQKLDALRKERRDSVRKIRDSMRDTRRKLHDAMEEGADMATIRKLAQQQGDQVARMIVLRAQTRVDINQLLTDAQRKELQSMKRSGYGGGKGYHHGW